MRPSLPLGRLLTCVASRRHSRQPTPNADRPGRRKDERPKRKPKPKNEGEYYRQMMHELAAGDGENEDDPILDAVVKARRQMWRR